MGEPRRILISVDNSDACEEVMAPAGRAGRLQLQRAVHPAPLAALLLC